MVAIPWLSYNIGLIPCATDGAAAVRSRTEGVATACEIAKSFADLIRRAIIRRRVSSYVPAAGYTQ